MSKVSAVTVLARGPDLPSAVAPCVLVDGDELTYLHENAPYTIERLPGLRVLLAIDDGRLIGVQFSRRPLLRIPHATNGRP